MNEHEIESQASQHLHTVRDRKIRKRADHREYITFMSDKQNLNSNSSLLSQ